MACKTISFPNKEVQVVSVNTAGNPVFHDFFAPSTPGIEQTAFSFVVPPGVERYIHNLFMDSAMPTTYQIYAGGSIIGSGRTGPGSSFHNFIFNPPRPIPAGTLVEVKFTVNSGSPVADVGVFLQSLDI